MNTDQDIPKLDKPVQDELSQMGNGVTSVAPLSIDTIKQCLGCKEVKPLTDFHREKHGRLGHASRCKTCVRKSIETCICQDCGKPIGNRATRCRSCESKRRWAEGLNDGLAENMRELWKSGHFDGNSEKMKARWANGEFNHPLSEERRRKLSESKRAWWAQNGLSDETQKKMSESHKIAWATGTYDYVKAYRKTPEYRAKMSEIKKAAWARGDYDNRKPRNQQESTN